MKMRKKSEQLGESKEDRHERRAISEEWKLLKAYEGFIYEIVFEMGIMDRLHDLRTFLELASDKYAKIKEERQKRNTQSGMVVGHNPPVV